MRITGQPSRSLLFVGMLGIAVSACGSENEGGDAVTPSGSGASATGGMPGDGSGGAAAASDGAMSGGSTSAASGGASEGTTGGTSVTAGTGGSTSAGSGGASEGNTGGMGATAGSSSTSTASGGASEGNTGGAGATAGSSGSTSTASGGASGANGGSAGAPLGTGGVFTGTCTESEPVGTNATGSGPHDVIVETNSDPGIDTGTIFRPADLGGDEKYPIFVWGEGACSQNGLSNATAMAEIASHGYFVVADGTPNGTGNIPMDRSDMEAMGAPLIGYIDWAIAENGKPCSAYYQSLDTTKVASNGFSCGGLMSQGTIPDPRITTWGVTSSGMAGADPSLYEPVSTPVLFVEGGPSDSAYNGGLEGYENISQLDVPVMWFSKELGHGGDLSQPGGGDFTKINLAWLNWWLKGDETATGKGLLVGPDCPYCSDSAWEVMSDDLP